jgi:FkbM family methyltransferase
MSSLAGFKYKKLTAGETLALWLSRIADRLHIAPNSAMNIYYKIRCRNLIKNYLKSDGKNSFFDIAGARLPDISTSKEKMKTLALVFEDSFLVPACYDDNYDRALVEKLDRCMAEGPYGYRDGSFDVTVKRDDVVVDAGAWIGDFSAYAASKGATVYAFEPTEETFVLLCRAAELNNNRIIPVRKGLGETEGEVALAVDDWSGGNSIVMERKAGTETISLTTIDRFVEENGITRLDFIKADIEGAERDMLRGATKTLKTLAPKLAICTYHLPDDPTTLEQIIRDANPAYKIVHLRHKLFASVSDK